MQRIRQRLGLFRRDKKGATLVEFGFVVGPLCVMLMGISDLGYQSYLDSVARGVLQKAARKAAVGSMNSAQIDAYLNAQLKTIKSKQGTATVSKKSYYNFSNVGKPEKITNDKAPTGSYNVGDCYEDANSNNVYDVNTGAAGLGGADDIVYYEVTITMPRLFPMAKMLGWNETMTSKATTLLRNQPWTDQNRPSIRCN
jgi:Flp pilus assembly protein TadG